MLNNYVVTLNLMIITLYINQQNVLIKYNYYLSVISFYFN